MCGIAGIIAPESGAYTQALGRMVKALKHRGPDGDGTHFFPNCALGHARLSIVDLQSGSQPMLEEDGNRGITFNGEIYGYRDIRKNLDYHFHTTSDTEVILALYAKHGPEMMTHLPGMFSFALWDEKEQSLFCGRDRFGEKPFFYAFGKDGQFIFASEIKALLASYLIQPVVSRSSLAHYLKRGYVHPTRTVYENVYTLPPAHYLRFSGGKASVKRYWCFPETREQLSLSDAVEEFKELLTRAVEKQLIADVEVGAFLSGGLDSSTLVALATKKYPRLKTYSFGFKREFSELPYARLAAKQYSVQNIELLEEGHNIAELLVKMSEVSDEPLYDSAIIPTYLICKLARSSAKVALAGEGADELLGGYSWWYNRSIQMERGKDTSAWVRPALFAAAAWERVGQGLKGIDPGASSAHRKWRDRWRGVRDWRAYGSVIKEHQVQTSIAADYELEQLGLGSYIDESTVTGRCWEPSNTTDDALRVDLEDYLAGDILVKTDRASMAHGLELRAPFLDVDFASFCLSLPAQLKVSGQADKIILREAFLDQWPEALRTRPKQGFGAPLDNWVLDQSIKDLKCEYLDSPDKKLYQLLPFETSRQFARGSARKLWLLLVLAVWAENALSAL